MTKQVSLIFNFAEEVEDDSINIEADGFDVYDTDLEWCNDYPFEAIREIVNAVGLPEDINITFMSKDEEPYIILEVDEDKVFIEMNDTEKEFAGDFIIRAVQTICEKVGYEFAMSAKMFDLADHELETVED